MYIRTKKVFSMGFSKRDIESLIKENKFTAITVILTEDEISVILMSVRPRASARGYKRL